MKNKSTISEQITDLIQERTENLKNFTNTLEFIHHLCAVYSDCVIETCASDEDGDFWIDFASRDKQLSNDLSESAITLFVNAKSGDISVKFFDHYVDYHAFTHERIKRIMKAFIEE